MKVMSISESVDPLRRVRLSYQLNMTSRGLRTALAAVFLLLTYPIAAQAHEPQARISLVVIKEPTQYLAKPTITLTKVTPEPRKRPTKRPTSSTQGGNGYDYGYCTWYVATRRPDLPRNLGNARTWLTRAKAQGLATGTTPAVGAVVETGESRYGHVGFVTDYDSESGQITISEANYAGWNKVTTRTISIYNPKIIGYIYAP